MGERVERSLLRQAGGRLVTVLALAGASLAGVAGWYYGRGTEIEAERRTATIRQLLSLRLAAQEAAWQRDADGLRSEIELLRLPERTDQLPRLTALLEVVGARSGFERLAIIGADSRLLYRFGHPGEDLITDCPNLRQRSWCLHRSDGSLSRIVRRPLRFGHDKSTAGEIAIFYRVGNDFLVRNGLVDTDLFLAWGSRAVASSLGEASLAEIQAGRRGPVVRDGVRYDQQAMAFGEGPGERPTLIVQHRIERTISARQLGVAVATLTLAIGVAVWAVLGHWIVVAARRIGRLKFAASTFRERYQFTAEVETALREAAGQRNDEIADLGEAMEFLAHEVIRRMSAQDAGEKAVRESDRRLREITDVLADGVYVLDTEGNVTFINPEGARLLGWRQDELLGRNAHETFHYLKPDGSPLPLGQCPIHRGDPHRPPYRGDDISLVRQDGTLFPVFLASTPLVREGRVTGSVTAFHDISRLKRAESAIRDSERRFRALFNGGTDAIYVLPLARAGSPAARIVEVNEVACQRLGYSHDEFLGMTLDDLDAPGQEADGVTWMDRLIQEGHLLFEREHLARDGRRIPVEINASLFPLRGQAMVIAVSRDVSERRQAEIEYRQIIQTAIDGYWLCDATTGRFLDVNDALCATLGYARDELLRIGVADVEAGAPPETVRAHLAGIVTTGHSRFETRLRRKDGAIVDVEVSCRHADSRGGVVFVFARDITERKIDEARIRRLAFFDPLTGLPNRRLLNDRLDQALALAGRYQRLAAILFVDLDRFKDINDAYGHGVGDEVLKIVAQRLSASVRYSDTVSRQGGDEFVVLLPEVANAANAEMLAQKILDVLAKPVVVGEHRMIATPSVGIALYPDDATDGESLVSRADEAMYAAKTAGRNCYRRAPPSMETSQVPPI